MHDKELYAKILGIEEPWQVTDVELNLKEGEVQIHIANKTRGRHQCPECGKAAEIHDTKERRWRHLDTCQYRTILVAKVPRVKCSEHGVKQIKVPWSEPGSRFTAMYEALVIDWIKESNISGVARVMGLTWDQVDGIMQRAVSRGLERREKEIPENIGVDEKAFRKGHEYVTVVSDQNNHRVQHVAEGRKKESLGSYYEQYSDEDLKRVKTVTMDMWEPFIQSTIDSIPEAEKKICYDKFHVAKHLGEAVDRVRRKENKELIRWGDGDLKGTRYFWLKNPENMSDEQWASYGILTKTALKTARAWAIKELAMSLWYYRSRGWARRAWEKWYGRAIRSRLEPVKRVARMVKQHMEGILNAVVHNVTNAGSEGINSVIQKIINTARGFRNKERFKNAIYFYLGGLDLYPEGVRR